MSTQSSDEETIEALATCRELCVSSSSAIFSFDPAQFKCLEYILISGALVNLQWLMNAPSLKVVQIQEGMYSKSTMASYLESRSPMPFLLTGFDPHVFDVGLYLECVPKWANKLTVTGNLGCNPLNLHQFTNLTSLDFCRFEIDDLEKFEDALQKVSPTLFSLQLSQCFLQQSPDALSVLGRTFSCLSQLKTLKLGPKSDGVLLRLIDVLPSLSVDMLILQTQTTPTEFLRLASTITQTTSLTHVDLSHLQVAVNHVWFNQLRPQISFYQTWARCILDSPHVAHWGIDGGLIEKDVLCLESLSELPLQSLVITSCFALPHPPTSWVTTLHSLELHLDSHFALSDANLGHLLQNCTQLRTLKIKFAGSVRQLLLQIHLKHLKRLYLEEIGFGQLLSTAEDVQFADQVFAHLPKLQVLRLENLCFTGVALQRLCAALHEYCRDLQHFHTSVPSYSMAALASLVEKSGKIVTCTHHDDQSILKALFNNRKRTQTLVALVTPIESNLLVAQWPYPHSDTLMGYDFHCTDL